MPTTEAIKEAQKVDLDLVEVSPTANPPICKLMDYGKYKFSQKKQKPSKTGIKGVRLGLRTDVGDINIKANSARKFLKQGHKVQVTMTLRGREMAHKEQALEVINSFKDELSSSSKVEREAKIDGRKIILILAPKK